MANQEHLDILKQGVDVWNQWRKEHPEVRPDLSRADLIGDQLVQANLSGANLSRAYLGGASLGYANLSFADLNGAILARTSLDNAILLKADLSKAILWRSHLWKTHLNGANLSKANLIKATLDEVDFTEATLSNCYIYGISVWNVKLQGTKQNDLIITRPLEATITVDNLEVAQFIYLLLNNKKIREVIDTITSKVVLILGRFTPERKVILDAIRDELRKRNYLPVLFDFEKPASRSITETVSTLAHLARFVIADMTEPKSIPQELSYIVPFLTSVPIVPVLQVSEREYGMYEHFVSYPWVQPVYHYRDLDELLHSLQQHVIDPAEQKVRELAIEKAKRLEKP